MALHTALTTLLSVPRQAALTSSNIPPWVAVMSVRYQQTCTLMACPQRVRKHQENTQELSKYSKNVWRNFHPHEKFFQYQKFAQDPFGNLQQADFWARPPLEQLRTKLTRELDAPPSALGLWPLWVKACLSLCYFPANFIHILSPEL